MINNGLTRNDAIAIALINNKKLQYLLENLGIAKSNLEQAKLFTNPLLYASFEFILKDCIKEFETIRKNVFFDVRWFQALSDLWKIPYRKQVFKDDLEIAILEIVNNIISITAEAKKAYDESLYSQIQLQNINSILKETIYLKKLIKEKAKLNHKKNYKEDIAYADLTVGEWELEKVDYLAKIAITDMELKKALGLVCPDKKIIKLVSSLEDGQIDIPNMEDLQNLGLCARPDIQKTMVTIKKYEDTSRYEKSRIFNSVNIGFEAGKGYFDEKYSGPLLLMDLPFFDQNQFQVAKANIQAEQTKKELVNLKINVRTEIFSKAKSLDAILKQIKIYQNRIIKAAETIIEFRYKFKSYITAQISIYRTRYEYITLNFKALNLVTDLEKAISKRLNYEKDKIRYSKQTILEYLKTMYKHEAKIAPKLKKIVSKV